MVRAVGDMMLGGGRGMTLANDWSGGGVGAGVCGAMRGREVVPGSIERAGTSGGFCWSHATFCDCSARFAHRECSCTTGQSSGIVRASAGGSGCWQSPRRRVG